MLVADDAAAFLQPFDVDAVRDVPGDPHQEDQHHAEREREAQVVVRVLRPLRPGGERLRPDQRQQQRPAEGDVEAGKREDDEAGSPSSSARSARRRRSAPARARSARLRSAPCRGSDRRRPAAPACRGSRWRRSSAASPGGSGASRGRRAARCVQAFWSGSVQRPEIRLSSLSSCFSLTELAVGLTELSGLRCWALTGAAQGDNECERQRADDETDARQDASPCVFLPSSRVAPRPVGASPVRCERHDAIVSR